MINIRRLKKINEEKKKNNMETYNKIFEKFCNKINYMGDIGKDECWFTVPHFILGIPPYDLDKCCDYIKYKIKEIEFTKYKFYEPNVFYVSWS